MFLRLRDARARKHILKQQTPLWLAQHPHIMAFHQAPKSTAVTPHCWC
jgi:DNA-nicking Smr family endonuclease